MFRDCVVRGGVEPPTFRFSGIGTFPGQRGKEQAACTARALSVLNHDRLRQPGGIAMSGQLRQRRRYLRVPTFDSVQVAVSGGGRCMAQAAHQILYRRARRSRQSLSGVAEVVEPETRHPSTTAVPRRGTAFGAPRAGLWPWGGPARHARTVPA